MDTNNNSDNWRDDINYRKRRWFVDDDIVISGISGRYPKSENVQQFKENLFNKVDMMTGGNDRYPAGKHGFPYNCGKVQNLDQFDAKFFNISDQEANLMDPQLRKLLEVSFECLVDAGLSLDDIKGTKTGLYWGSSFQETDNSYSESPLDVAGYKNHYNTILSHFYDINGPIAAFDTACASSFCALNEAFMAMKSGDCDQAFVASYNICLLPDITLNFRDLKMISMDGKSKPLDESANGYGRSEAVCCIFLQRQPEAKRIYSTIVNCRANTDGYKEIGINFPSMERQRRLMLETFDEVALDPINVNYIEAHTTGTQAGDPVETKAIYDVFCPQRTSQNPLLVGSIKSNMGHAEAAAGLCAMTKALIVFQERIIPPTIHYRKPNPKIQGLMDGKLKPVLQLTPFEGDYISLNAFGFGGSNVHVILKSPRSSSSKSTNQIATDIPRLVPICSRTADGVLYIQDYLKKNIRSISNEFLHLLNKMSTTIASKMPYKGYTIIDQINDEFLFSNHNELPRKNFSKCILALPTQLIQFDARFKHIPIFCKTFSNLVAHGKAFNINLQDIIVGHSSSCISTSNMKEWMVKLVCCHLLIINLIKDIKIPASNLFGNFVSKISLAYKDKVISEEKAIFVAYWLGHYFDDEKYSPKNGQDYQIDAKSNLIKRQAQLPENYNTTNHISSSYEASKLIKSVEKYAEARKKNYDAENEQLTKLEIQKILSPANYPDDGSQNCLIINFDSPDHKSVEENKSTAINFMQDDHENILKMDQFLQSIGKIYCYNISLQIDTLYPKVAYPVPVNTLSLNSLLSWDHSKSYLTRKYPDCFNYYEDKTSIQFKVNISHAQDWFYADHKIDGRILFPAVGMLSFVWYAAARYYGIRVHQSKVRFEDMSFVRATLLTEKGVTFRVTFLPHNGSFMMTENQAIICTGKVFIEKDLSQHLENYKVNQNPIDEKNILSHEDVYKELRIRGYDYGPYFSCIQEADKHGKYCQVEWKEIKNDAIESASVLEKNHADEFAFMKSWTVWSDCILQSFLLSNPLMRNLFLPSGLAAVLVDAPRIIEVVNQLNLEHLADEKAKKSLKQEKETQKDDKTEEKADDEGAKSSKDNRNPIRFKANFDPITSTMATDGMWVRGINVNLVTRKAQRLLLETYDFVPYFENDLLDEATKSNLVDYYTICHKLAAAIKVQSNQGSQSILSLDEIESIKDNFDYQSKTSYVLMKHLIEKLNGKSDHSKEIHLHEDILIGQELQLSDFTRFFQPLLDIPLNQTKYSGMFSTNLAVLEYNESHNFLYQKVKHVADVQWMGFVKLSYAIASSTNDNLESVQQLDGDVKQIKWDAKSSLPSDVDRADILIYKNFTSNLSELQIKLENLLSSIKNEGSLVTIFREQIDSNILSNLSVFENVDVDCIKESCINSDNLISLLKEMGWICVAKKVLDSSLAQINGLIFRKKLVEQEKAIIIPISSKNYDWVDKLKDSLYGEDKTSPIVLTAEQSTDHGLFGFTKCLGIESGGERIYCLGNRYANGEINLTNLNPDDDVVKAIIEKGLKFNIYDSNHGWGTYCHLEVKENQEIVTISRQKMKDVSLQCLQPGDLSSLVWCDLHYDDKLLPNLHTVCYAALNFRDILFANGKLPLLLQNLLKQQSKSLVQLGMEYAGYDANGNRIMAILGSGAMCSRVEFDDQLDFCWPIPANMTMEEASTIPIVYMTSIYALFVRGKLMPGESVLIHAGSGGVGISAITLCLAFNCEVFTTVGSEEKRQFLFKQFPRLKPQNVGNSRDTSFEEMILRETNGRGVDVILNSLADDKLQASIRCLAVNGRFLEIGKFDGFQNTPINVGLLDQGKSFHGVMFDAFYDGLDKIRNKVSYEEIVRAIDLLDQFMKEGIVKPLPTNVFSMGHAEDAFRFMASGKHIGKVLLKMSTEEYNPTENIRACRTSIFYSDKSYLIVGGFGGLGLELALWLADKGAGTIVLNSRNGPQTSYHRYCLDRITQMSSNVILSTHNLVSEDACKQLIESLSKPLGGVFNSALVLKDNIIADQTPETFAQVCQPKIDITANLDKLTRKLCTSSLDYFVTFSSMACGRGNIGQSNYSLANSFMENVCERRRRDHLHGLAIQWGLIGDVGYVVEKVGSKIQATNTSPQRLYSCFSVLDKALSFPNSTICSMIRAEDKKSMIDSDGDILKTISHILGIKDIYALDPKITLGHLGMDSLMAIEIQQALERNYSVSMTTKEIRQLNVADLIALSKKLSTEAKDEDISENLEQIMWKDALPTELVTKLNESTHKKMIFVLPPIEGDYSSFGDIFKLLDAQVIGLNWTYDLINLTSIEEAASYYVDQILQLTNENLQLIAYSFGGMLAMKIANELENRKTTTIRVEKLVLIDCNVEKLVTAYLQSKSNMSDDETHRKFFGASVGRYIKDYDVNLLNNQLIEAVSDEERVLICKNTLIANGIAEDNADKIVKLNQLTYQKGAIASKFQYVPLINTQVIHLLAKEDLKVFKGIKKSLKIGEEFFFEGNHNNFVTKNMNEIGKIITNYLQ